MVYTMKSIIVFGFCYHMSNVAKPPCHSLSFVKGLHFPVHALTVLEAIPSFEYLDMAVSLICGELSGGMVLG